MAVIRQVELNDLPSIYVIEQACHPFPWSKRLLQDCLDIGYDCWLVEVDKTMAGFIIFATQAGESQIFNISIHPQFQRQGLGRQLLHHAIARAATQGADIIFLEVRLSNLAALQLYYSLGFNEIGIRPNYYQTQNGREDALTMALQL